MSDEETYVNEHRYWSDIASALEAMLDVPSMPEGLRPMIVQAIVELRLLKAQQSWACTPDVNPQKQGPTSVNRQL